MENGARQHTAASNRVMECYQLCLRCAARCIDQGKRELGARGLLPLALCLIGFAPGVSAQEKLEGKVVGTKLTHCDMNVKVGGCAGTLTLESRAGGNKQELNINVPLGTPITRAGETMYLPALRGKNVVVTHVMDKNERVAKAIEVPR